MRGRDPVYVGRVPVTDASLEEVVSEIVRLHGERKGARIATANTDFVALARRDNQLVQHLEASTIVVADGTPVAWLARAAGGRNVERIAGVDLVRIVLQALRQRGSIRIAIYGSTREVAEVAAAGLRNDDPGIQISPIICPPFGELSEAEVQAHESAIIASAPDLILVALGCPKQERFIAESFHCAPGAIWIGIGGTLDFYAGQRRRAPRWLQKAGFEWTVRLLQEPGRLWRRYFVRDLPTLAITAPRCLATRLRSQTGSEQPTLN